MGTEATPVAAAAPAAPSPVPAPASTPPQATKAEVPAAPAPPDYSAWAAAYQAFYGAGGQPPPGAAYYPSVPSSPQAPHPYVWGGQPMMAQYGASPPAPFSPMFHGAMYGHPLVGAHPFGQFPAQAPTATPATATPATAAAAAAATPATAATTAPSASEPPASKPKAQAPTPTQGFTKPAPLQKKDSDRLADEATAGASNSGSSGSDRSSGSDAGENKKRSYDILTVEGPSPTSGSAGAAAVAGATPGGSGEYWHPSHQDEREVKRQRRKQSNRESARRSRLRKQAECEELGTRVDNLTQENLTLRVEVQRLHDTCAALNQENNALQEQLRKLRSGSDGSHPVYPHAVAATADRVSNSTMHASNGAHVPHALPAVPIATTANGDAKLHSVADKNPSVADKVPQPVASMA